MTEFDYTAPSSWRPSSDRSRTDAPQPSCSSPRSEPRIEPARKSPRSSSPPSAERGTQGFQLPDFYSGATDRLACFTEGFCLRRLQKLSEGSEERKWSEL